MVGSTLRAIRAIALGGVLLPVWAHAESDPRSDVEEMRFLEELFALTDEIAALNDEVVRWFAGSRGEGLYPADYLTQTKAMRQRLEMLAPPPRVETVHHYVAESIRLQRAFIAEWYWAVEHGRPFSSQLTDEYAHHEGLHRSHRLLVKAYAELHALLPTAGNAVHRDFRDRLRAVDFR